MTANISSSAVWWLTIGIVLLPLISSIICFTIRDKFGWLSPIISSSLLLTTTISSIVMLFQLSTPLNYTLPWFSIGEKMIHASILLDTNSGIMVFVVALVSFLVHLFSVGYMANDPGQVRYFSMLGFFTFAMLGLVISGNLLMLFCFWELVGFSSYRLIGHWHERREAAKAATKAFLINRLGDLGFLIGLMIIWMWSGSLEITNINLSSLPTGWSTAAGVCIFVGVMGKSAQFPLLHWLPDAMEGPTPVSALIHAATMVAAGVYLLIRITYLFSETAFMIIAITGCITAIVGALGAFAQFDIKKILAYSTISQLGFMVLAIGAGSPEGGYLHLLNHAFFKAGLFLGAGAVIHAMHQAYHNQESIDVQDIRNLGGLRKSLPITFVTFTICAAALAGIPFTSGFVSKEIILDQLSTSMDTKYSWRWLIFSGAWLTTFLTPLYTFRLVWYIFYNQPKHAIKVIEVPVIMRIPLIVLSIGSIALFISYPPFHLSSFANMVMGIHFPTSTLISFVSILLVSIGLVLGYYLYKEAEPGEPNSRLSPHYYLDQLSGIMVSQITFVSHFSHWIDRKIIDRIIHGLTYLQVSIAHVTGWMDRYLVDGIVNGIAHTASGFGRLSRMLVNGKIQSYLLWALASLLIFILFVLY